jgi:dTDP-4-dehydrorhamnose 3,5-epimerase
MDFYPQNIQDVVLIKPDVFPDERGYFFESYQSDKWEQAIGDIQFIQDNESKSSFGVLRGLHFQVGEMTQSKLIRVIKGRIWDVAVDLRKDSPTYKSFVGVELNDENKHQLFIPKGFAHGFITLSQDAIISYKVDAFYSHKHDGGIRYNDENLGIPWPLTTEQILVSEKDKNLPLFKNIQLNW